MDLKWWREWPTGAQAKVLENYVKIVIVNVVVFTMECLAATGSTTVNPIVRFISIRNQPRLFAGYKSDSPQSSMTENNVSSILAGHGDGPFTSHATVNLAECTFPLRYVLGSIGLCSVKYVSLRLRVQNWTTKWHFPLNFRTVAYPGLLLKGPSFRVTEWSFLNYLIMQLARTLYYHV